MSGNLGNGWVQLYIMTSWTAEQLRRVEPILMGFTATFVAPAGLPMQTKNGLYEVRVVDVFKTVLVEEFLAKEGLVIVARDEHPPSAKAK